MFRLKTSGLRRTARESDDYFGVDRKVVSRWQIMGEIYTELEDNNWYGIPGVYEFDREVNCHVGVYYFYVRSNDPELKKRYEIDENEEMVIGISLDRFFNVELELAGFRFARYRDTIANIEKNIEITYQELFGLIKKAVQKMIKSGKPNVGRFAK